MPRYNITYVIGFEAENDHAAVAAESDIYMHIENNLEIADVVVASGPTKETFQDEDIDA
jgi:hypothetical protein